MNMCEYLSELFESCVKLFENMCVGYKRIFVKYILHFVFVFSLEKSVLKISKNAENISGSGGYNKSSNVKKLCFITFIYFVCKSGGILHKKMLYFQTFSLHLIQLFLTDFFSYRISKLSSNNTPNFSRFLPHFTLIIYLLTFNISTT